MCFVRRNDRPKERREKDLFPTLVRVVNKHMALTRNIGHLRDLRLYDVSVCLQLCPYMRNVSLKLKKPYHAKEMVD